jgi:hypothetical protein
MTDFELSKYIYWEYSLAVLLVTEIIRALTKNVNTKFVKLIIADNPKWLSIIVATFLAVLDWIILSNANVFHLWQFIISFGVAVLGYDYVVKLIKDKFFTKPTP